MTEVSQILLRLKSFCGSISLAHTRFQNVEEMESVFVRFDFPQRETFTNEIN